MKPLFISDIHINFARKKGSTDKRKRKKRIGLSTVLAGSAVAGGGRAALLTHLKYRKGYQRIIANNEADLAKAIKANNPHAHIIYPGAKKLKQIYIKKIVGRSGKGALASSAMAGLGYGAYKLISKKSKSND